jgi:hypothetical protein
MSSETDTHVGLFNLGAMGEFVNEFDVASRLTDQSYHCKFSHVWNAIATRHSDSVDNKFLVNGRSMIVGLAHLGFVEFRKKYDRGLTDREASYIAAFYLRERLEQEDERSLYDVTPGDVTRIIDQLGIR